MHDTVGQILKQRRTETNLSLEQASLVTHIRIKYLEALESDNHDLLPSEVQGKGFLRLYLEYLDLPVEHLVAVWSGKAPASQVSSHISMETLHPELETTSQERIKSVDQPPDFNDVMAQDTKYEPAGSTFNKTQPHESDAQEVFSEVGRTLKEQRELISLPLDDIENIIKIKTKYLQAIEEGRISDLPSPVQARGMINNYARLLNLNSDILLLRYAEGLQIQRGEKVSSNPTARSAISQKTPPRPVSRFSRLITADLIIVSLVIIGIFGFTVWGASRVSSFQKTTDVAIPPSISEFLLTTRTISPQPANTPLSPTTVSGSLSETIISPQATLNPRENLPLFQQQATAAVQISVLSKQRTWLQVYSDRKLVFNGRTLPGNSYPYSATERIELSVANAAAIQISFNQKDMGTIGLGGQVVTLVFTRDGMRNPTPTVSSTPTRTVPVTPSGSPTLNPAIRTATVTPFIP